MPDLGVGGYQVRSRVLKFGRVFLVSLVLLAACSLGSPSQGADPPSEDVLLRAEVAANPTSPGATFAWAEYLYARGRRAEAEAQYRATLVLDPEFSVARIGLGNVLNELGESESALLELNRVLERDPKNPTAICVRGQTYYALQRYDEAIGEYRRAIALEPRNQQAHYNLGIAFADAGIFKEAIREWRRVVSAGSTTEIGQLASESIEVLASMVGEGF